jgi:glycosyltransferase involved in cell wall biosynthesis
MNIVVLYSELVGYTQGTLQAIIDLDPDANVDAIYWDKKKLSAYKLEAKEGSRLRYWPRSSYDRESLYQVLLEKRPEVIYVSGWMDKDYLYAIKKYKSRYSTKVVAGIDDQWRGTLRQYIGVVVMKLYYKKIFDYLWVSGKPQYLFAGMMGFDRQHIISDLYSANKYHFSGRATFTKRFVYLGRFAPVKGVLNLIKAYEMLPETVKEQWPLVMIGDGSEKEEMLNIKSNHVIVLPFLQGDELVEELRKGGVACSSSLKEAWGVVIHEMALMGYPLLLSNECGAATEYLISGYNGFMFDPRNDQSMTDAMLRITKLSQEQLLLFAERSAQLGSRINSEISAAALLSVQYL